MMPHDTSAKARPSREVREERARAFWQAQINEGRARAAEQQARTNKQAAPRQEPPPSPAPPARVPLHVVSAETPPTAETPPIDPSHLAGLSPTAITILELINAGTADGRRYTATPPMPKIARPGASCSATFPSLTDQASSDGNRYVAAKRGSRTSNLSRPSQSSRHPRVVCKLTSISAMLSLWTRLSYTTS